MDVRIDIAGLHAGIDLNVAVRQQASPEDLAERLYRLRRRRSDVFGAMAEGLLGEPVWDMLLDLYIAKARGRRISVTSLCIAADVPPTTALRWITLMVDRGMVHRAPDPGDRRRAFLDLTEDMFQRMTELLSGWFGL